MNRPVLVPIVAALVLIVTGCGSSAAPSSASAATSAAAASARPVAGSSSPAVAAAGEWAGFRGDASHTGNGATGPIGHPVVTWQYHAKGAVAHAITIIGDQVSFASDDGTVYALDRATGAERWVVHVAAAPLIGPWAADGRLYFLDGNGSPMALDAATGKVLWTSSTSYDGPNEPVVDRGTMYFGTSDGHLVAIDGSTGAEAWNLKPAATTEWVGNPAVADGRVIAGTSTGFVAIDVATHQVAWTADTHGEQTGTAGANAGVAFLGSGADATDSHARSFDVASGAVRWTADHPGLTFPIAADGLVVSSTMSGYVQAMDLATGAVRWSIQLSGRIRPMAIAGGVLYVPADTERRLYAVDLATGGKLWQLDVDHSNDCCVAVAGNSVYVGTMAGTVYAIGGDGATVAAVPFGGGSGPSGSAPATSASPTPAPIADIPVTVSWTTDLRRMGFEPISQIAIHPVTHRVWAPEATDDQIAVIDPAGKVLEEWGQSGSAPGQFRFMGPHGGYGTLAFAQDGSFFVLDIGNRRIEHYDTNRKRIGGWGGFGNGPGTYGDPVGIVVAADGTVWVVDDQRSVIEHYKPDGTVLGSFDPFAATPSNDGTNNLAIDAQGLLYMSGAGPNRVSVFDQTGKVLRYLGDGIFTEQPTNIAVDAKGRVFVTQGPDRGPHPGVLVFGPDGSYLGGWGQPGAGDGELTFPAGIALDGKGGVYVEDSMPDTARMIRFELPATLR